MNAREELLKITIGKTVTGLLLLIGFLCATIWRETLFQKWTQVAEGVSRPALMAALGLVLIGLVLALGLIAYLLYLLYRRQGEQKSITGKNAISPPLAGYIGMLGVLWDGHDNPCCPICKCLMSGVTGQMGTLKCPGCSKRFVLKDDVGLPVNMMNAKRRLIERRYELNQQPLQPPSSD